MPPAAPAASGGADRPPRAERSSAGVNAGGFVFGVITVGALMAAESGRHERYIDLAGSTVIAMLVYWLAHAYSELLGQRLASGEPLTARGLGKALLHEWAILRGAAIPLAALLIAWAVGAGREAGVTAALRTAVATIVVLEVLAGVQSRSPRGELLLRGSVGVAIGLAILAMRKVLV